MPYNHGNNIPLGTFLNKKRKTLSRLKGIQSNLLYNQNSFLLNLWENTPKRFKWYPSQRKTILGFKL